MNRKDEIKESIKQLNELVDVATKESLTNEQITNISIAAITNQLADISYTLAIIADKLGGKNESR